MPPLGHIAFVLGGRCYILEVDVGPGSNFWRKSSAAPAASPEIHRRRCLEIHRCHPILLRLPHANRRHHCHCQGHAATTGGIGAAGVAAGAAAVAAAVAAVVVAVVAAALRVLLRPLLRLLLKGLLQS